jgi:hypothetical protein
VNELKGYHKVRYLPSSLSHSAAVGGGMGEGGGFFGIVALLTKLIHPRAELAVVFQSDLWTVEVRKAFCLDNL